jgi:hypothetical protein
MLNSASFPKQAGKALCGNPVAGFGKAAQRFC